MKYQLPTNEEVMKTIEAMFAKNRMDRDAARELTANTLGNEFLNDGDNAYKENLEREMLQKIDDDWYKDYVNSRR